MLPDDPGGERPPPHYVDAADRLERVIDVQIATLNGIDEKAEHVTRLVGILLGVVLSVLSVVVRAEAIALSSPSFPTGLTFVVGLGSLLVSMGLAILTYLGSRFDSGLGRRVGLLLSDSDYSVGAETYARRTLGTYGHAIRKNTAVIDANARRFRWTLVALAVGVVYLTLSTVLYVARGIPGPEAPASAPAVVAWSAVLATTAATAVASGYVLTGGYLTLSEEGGADD